MTELRSHGVCTELNFQRQMLKIADMCSVVQTCNVAATASTLLHSPALFPTREQVVRGQFPDVCCLCE